MNQFLLNALDQNHEALRFLFDAYEINAPATPENVAQATREHGAPFLADLDEYVIGPYADMTLSMPDDDDDAGQEYFIGKIKDRIQARRAGKASAGDGGAIPLVSAPKMPSARSIRRAEKQQAKAYKTADQPSRWQNILTGVADFGINAAGGIMGGLSAGLPKGQAIMGGLLQGAGEGIDYLQASQYPSLAADAPAYASAPAAPAEKPKNKMLIYVGIAAAVVLIGGVLLLTRKKK